MLTALYELKDGQNGSGTDSSPSTSVFPCPHLSINILLSTLSTFCLEEQLGKAWELFK